MRILRLLRLAPKLSPSSVHDGDGFREFENVYNYHPAKKYQNISR